MAWIVEVKPDWHIAPGEPNDDQWAPAMPEPCAFVSRSVESTFEWEESAAAFLACARLCAPRIATTARSQDYELRLRELTLLDIFEETETPPPTPP